ncbi:hypothetical protein [Cohnella sp. JJ-181]|uniref:hypothetical protein n=1 Tax=Cohnella rhizoplanae TaxID=2974897 RepID=UPI0022FFAC32|nr:hypothetical protein [Cohnella sp. JJ-181]CAI6027475.1 hypothetical protein COHCIP112018_00565 [Cohnella sp. JJ-181]
MNKRRALLVGLGVGLMAGAALLQLMTFGERLSEGAAMPEALTVEQLQVEAEGRGFAMYKLSEPMYTKAQLDEAVASARAEAQAASDAATPSPSAGAKPSPSPSATAKPSPSATAKPSPASEASAGRDTKLGLYIAAGDSLDKVATGLKALGVIQDKAAFLKAAKPFGGKMQVGLSVFEGQITYDEIVAELVRNKN